MTKATILGTWDVWCPGRREVGRRARQDVAEPQPQKMGLTGKEWGGVGSAACSHSAGWAIMEVLGALDLSL